MPTVQVCPWLSWRHETRFAALTQAIGEHVVDAQLAELRQAQRVHETFTELSFEQAGPVEVLRAVHRLADGPVVLENAQHRPLDFHSSPRKCGSRRLSGPLAISVGARDLHRSNVVG